MSRAQTLLVEKAKIIRNLSILLKTSTNSDESVEVVSALLQELKESISLVLTDYEALQRIDKLFDTSELEGSIILNQFFNSFLYSILLELILINNDNIAVQVPALTNITSSSQILSMVYKIIDGD